MADSQAQGRLAWDSDPRGKSRLRGACREDRGPQETTSRKVAVTWLLGSRGCFVSRSRAISFTSPSGFSHRSSVSQVISCGENTQQGMSLRQ